jgi:hypothetical protein
MRVSSLMPFALGLLACACGGKAEVSSHTSDIPDAALTDTSPPDSPQADVAAEDATTLKWVCASGDDGCQCHYGPLAQGETGIDPGNCVAPTGGCCFSNASTRLCLCALSNSWCGASTLVEPTCAKPPAIMGCDTPGKTDTYGLQRCPDRSRDPYCECDCTCKTDGTYECRLGHVCT